jgi:hypothetical protein
MNIRLQRDFPQFLFRVFLITCPGVAVHRLWKKRLKSILF